MSQDIIDVGGAAAPTPERFIVAGTDGKRYNTKPLHDGLQKLVAAQKMVLKNPTDAGAAWKLINDGRMEIGAFQQRMPMAIRPALQPMISAANGPMLEAAREAKYREIRDAELDFRTGKLSREDYEAIDGALRAEALEILNRLGNDGEQGPDVEGPAAGATGSVD